MASGGRPVPAEIMAQRRAARGLPPAKVPPKKAPKFVPLPEPHDLTPAQSAYWTHFNGACRRLGVCVENDTVSMRHMVELAARVDELRDKIAAEGDTYETSGPSGTIIRAHPHVAMRAAALKELRSHLISFGLNPSARTALKTAPPPDDEASQEHFD